MRRGLPFGLTADTVLLLDFDRGSLVDRSGTCSDGTLTADGGAKPIPVDGYFGRDGYHFNDDAASADRRRIVVADTAGIRVSADFTIEAWVRSDATVADVDTIFTTEQWLIIVSRMGANAGASAWSLMFKPGKPQFRIVDSGGSTHAVAAHEEETSGWLEQYPGQWHYIKAVNVASSALWLFQDGELVGYSPHALADVNDAVGTDIWVGAEESYVAAESGAMVGRIGAIRIRSSADTSEGFPDAERITRRHFYVEEMDLVEEISGLDWQIVGDQSTAYRSELSLFPWCTDDTDIVSVQVTLSGTTTTLTRVGSYKDVGSASNNWALDWNYSDGNGVAGQLWLGVDTSAQDLVTITIRTRYGTRSMIRGTAPVMPALLNGDCGERRFAYWDQAIPVGGGGKLSIARHADFPSGFGSEIASNVIWTNAVHRSYVMTDYMPWASAVVGGVGIVDAQPDETPDTIEARILPEAARLFRVPGEEDVANYATFPNLSPGAAGHPWPTILGRGHRRVDTVCVDTTATVIASQSMFKRKICNHAIARIAAIGVGTNTYTSGRMYNIDLDAATFYSTDNPDAAVWADVDGFGNPSSPTSTPGTGYASFGDGDETYVTIDEILQALLTAKLPSPAYGSTWAATIARVALRLRRAAELQDGAGLARVIQAYSAEGLVHLYFDPATEQWELEDVVKADASEWTIADADIIAEEIGIDRERVAKLARCTALAYFYDESNVLKIGRPTKLSLDPAAKYQAANVWIPGAGEMVGLPSKADADAWLVRVQPFLEYPSYFATVTVSSRYATAEQFDVVTFTSSAWPSGAGQRCRVQSVHPIGGQVKLVLMSEQHYPATGTAANIPRDPFAGPLPRLSWGTSNYFTALADTATAWTSVPGSQTRLMGIGFGTYPSSITHRLSVDAKRIGGASDTDLQVRIATSSGTAIATISAGFATTREFKATTTVANIPSTDDRIFLQYRTDNAATADIYAASFESEEGASNDSYEEHPPFTLANISQGTSIANSVVTAWTPTWVETGFFPSPLPNPVGVRYRWLVHASPSASSSLFLRIREFTSGYQSSWGNGTILATFPEIASGGYYASTEYPAVPSLMWPTFWIVEYRLPGGGAGAAVNALSLEIKYPIEEEIL